MERISLALQHQRAGGAPTTTTGPGIPPSEHPTSSLLLPGMTDSMLSSATTSDHDASSVVDSSSFASQPASSALHPTTSEPHLDTSGLMNSSNDWVSEFQAQLARDGGERANGGSDESPSESMLLLSGTQTSMSLPETDEQRSESDNGMVRDFVHLSRYLAGGMRHRVLKMNVDRIPDSWVALRSHPPGLHPTHNQKPTIPLLHPSFSPANQPQDTLPCPLTRVR